MTNPSKCAVCGITATQKCGGCKLQFYCGKEHQKCHWKNGHKAECKCFEITRNAVLGRHLRATRDIKKGEIILREPPLIYGPKLATPPICLGCHEILNPPKEPQRNFYKCSKCGWPMCGAKCETLPQHVDECELMASRKFKAKIDFNPNVKKESAYCVILPLRCIIMKSKHPESFAKFAALEDHVQERLDTPLYSVLRANLITFVKTILGLSEWEELEIMRVAARLDTNCFEIRHRSSERKLRAIYPIADMMSHDCTSNARHTFDEQMHILFIAKTAISKGEIIATSYTQPLKSTLMRREHLHLTKCFDCLCTRCADPTELGTYIGAILCRKCKVGKVLSTDPLDNNAVWNCQLCPHKIPAKQISWGNTSMQKEIDALDKTSPQALEEFIYRYRETLHEQNTHVLQVKYALTQLYGNAPGFLMKDLNDAGVKRKVELCYELLELAEVLDSGSSIFRGNLLLDLQEALMVKTKRDFLSGLLTRDETHDKLMESMKYLQEAVEIMKLEPGMQETLHERMIMLTAELECN